MDVTVKKIPASQVAIIVTLPWAEWEKEIAGAVRELGKEVKIPGFRPGNIPRQVLEQRLGKPALLAEAAEQAVRKSYPGALKQEKIQAIGEPAVKLEKLTEGEALEYRVQTAVMPAVKMKDFRRSVKKINAEFKEAADEVPEAEIMAELERLADMRAPLVTVRRPAQTGDSVAIVFSIAQDGVPMENGSSQNHTLVLGKNVFIPGFEDQVVGMSENQEKKFTLRFPENYHAKSLAGRDAEFTVNMRVVQEKRHPALDDSFAKSLGNFESLEKVKTNLRHGMLEEKKAKRRENRRSALLDSLVAASEVELPEILVSEELERMLREFALRTESMGVTLEQMLAQTKKTREDIKKEWRPQAEKRVIAHVVLDYLADEEKMEIESAAIEAEMNKALQYYQSEAEAKKIDTGRLYQAVREQLRNEKVFQWLEGL